MNIAKIGLLVTLALGLVMSLPSFADHNKKTKQCNIYRTTSFQGSATDVRILSLKEKTAPECCAECRAGRSTQQGSNLEETIIYSYCGGKNCKPFTKTSAYCTDQLWLGKAPVDCSKATW